MTAFGSIPSHYERHDGQTATPEQIARGEAMADKVFGAVDHVDEADKFTEAILKFVANVGAERGLSPEQQVFAVATATIHLRKTFPAGTDRFDAVCQAAQAHYDADQ